VLAALPILSALISLGASLLMLVMLMASGANSSEKQIHQIWIFIWSVIVIGVLSLIAAIWAFIKAQYGLSAAAAIVPAIYCVALLAWMLVTEW